MESELQILKNLEKSNSVTQRDIAKNTGMSLGNVNILIKRLIRKGMLKIEKLNTRTIRYILTPEGLKEKSFATYRYIMASYKLINETNIKIDLLLNNQLGFGIRHAVLFGDQDEICRLLQSRLNQMGIPHKCIHNKCIHTVNEPDKLAAETRTGDAAAAFSDTGSVILVWHPDYAEVLQSRNITYTNLLDRI